MPWLATHKTGLPDADNGGDPLIRNVTVGAQSRSVLCAGFVGNENRSGADRAVAEYVAKNGGAIDDWDVVQVSFAIYISVTEAIYQSILEARAATREARKNALRTGFGQYVKRVNQAAGTDLVLVIPPAGAERKEFLKSLRLLILEALDLTIDGEEGP